MLYRLSANHHYDHWLEPAAPDRARRSGAEWTRFSNPKSCIVMHSSLPALSLPARAVIGLIRLYKLTLSPFVGRDCRYLPTCSAYAADAVRAHGAWKGGWMAGARLCRCHPWGGSGYDPAPAIAPHAPWWAPWRYGDWKGGRRDVPVAEG